MGAEGLADFIATIFTKTRFTSCMFVSAVICACVSSRCSLERADGRGWSMRWIPRKEYNYNYDGRISISETSYLRDICA